MYDATQKELKVFNTFCHSDIHASLDATQKELKADGAHFPRRPQLFRCNSERIERKRIERTGKLRHSSP